MIIKNRAVKLIASNTIFQLGSKFVTMSVTFLLTYLISNKYGAYGYGLFTIFQSFPSTFYIISDFGLNAIGAREISKNLDKVDEIFSNILGLRVIISIITLLISLILSFALYDSPEILFGLALANLIIVSQTLVSTTNIIFQIKLRYDISSISNVIGYLFILIFSLIFINYSVSVVYINFLYVVALFISFAINLSFIKKYQIKIQASFSKDYIKSLVSESWPLGLMFVFSQINFRSDSILLSILPQPKSIGLNNISTVGVYGLPYKIFEVILVIPTFMMNSIYPMLLDAYNTNKRRFIYFFQNILYGISMIGFMLSLILYVSIAYFIDINLISSLFGSEFIYSKDLLLILISGITVFFITQPLSWYLVIKGKQKILPVVYFISAIFNFGMNYLLIPKYSFYASAYLTWISELIILLLLGFYTYKFWERDAR